MSLKEKIKKISLIILPQKVDTRLVQIGGFVMFLLYVIYELGKSFQKNEEIIEAVRVDTFAIVFALAVACFSVFAGILLINFIHWLFVRRFDQEKMSKHKFALTVPENWFFIGIMQVTVSVGIWLFVALPSLLFEGDGFRGVLAAERFSLLYKVYFISLCLVGILELISLIELLRMKKSGIYWLVVSLFVCLLGVIPRAINAAFEGGNSLQELKPGFDMLLNFAIIFFSMRKVTLKEKTN